MDVESPWNEPAWIVRTRQLLDSYRKWLGTELLSRGNSDKEDARRLYEAPFVVVAHGTEEDPILNYANRAALELWETDLESLLSMPSRLTAEPVHRDERAHMLARTTRDGFIDDYSGIRIAATGKRFRIERATVWNVVDAEGAPSGQAATFSNWTPLSEA